MAHLEESRYTPLNVLVIDDQPFVRKTVTVILRQMGFTKIKEAENGEVGLLICEDHTPDVIVCDIEMKPIDGLGFLKALRNDEKVKNKDIPVVFLTNHAESEVVKEAISLGVNAFIIKPPSLGALKGKIDKVLGFL